MTAVPTAAPNMLIGIKNWGFTSVNGIAPSVIPTNPIAQFDFPVSLNSAENLFFLITVAIAYAKGGIQIAALMNTFGW